MTEAGRALFRYLRHAPIDAVAVTVMIAFVGAVATVAASIAGDVLMASLPVPESQRVVALRTAVGERSPGEAEASAVDRYQVWSEEFGHLEAEPGPLDALASYTCALSAVEAAGWTGALEACEVTEGFFAVTTTRLHVGAVPAADTDQALVSYDLWRERLGSNVAALGTPLVVDGKRYTVVGVWVPGTSIPTRETAIWTVRAFRSVHGVRWRAPALGRLGDGVGIESATSALAAALASTTGRHGDDIDLTVTQLEAVRRRAVRPLLLGVGLVLVFIAALAFVSVASAAWLRTLRTEPDRFIRVALGAPRAVVVTGEVMPFLVLVAFASGVGVLAGTLVWARITEADLAPTWLPHQAMLSHSWTRSVLMYIATLAFGTVASLTPAVRAWRQASTGANRMHVRATGGGGKDRATVRHMILSTHVACVGAALVIAVATAGSWATLMRQDLGLSVDGVSALRLTPEDSVSSDPERRAELYATVRSEVATLLGADAEVAVVNILPLTASNTYRSARRADVPFAEAPEVMAALRLTSTQYFAVVQSRLLRGRGFTEGDYAGSDRAMIISENLAALLFGNEDAIGRTVRCYPEVCTVVGVVAAVRHTVFDEPEMAMYIPLSQASRALLTPTHLASMWLVARRRDGTALPIERIAEHVRHRHPDVVATHAASMDRLLSAQLWPRTLVAGVVSVVGACGVTLVVAAIYVLLRRAVLDRQVEIALRAAVGAPPHRLCREVVGRSLVLVLASMAGGVGVGMYVLQELAARPAYAGMLGAVRVWDAAIGAAIVLGAATLAASASACLVLLRVDAARMLRQ